MRELEYGGIIAMYTRIYEYEDIDLATEPHILYKLPINDTYTILATINPPDNTIRLMISDIYHNFLDTDGTILPSDSPYVSTVVFNTPDIVDVDNILKSEMLKLASTVYNNLVENNIINEGDSDIMDDVWEKLKSTDPFNRGWSTNPQDAIDTLLELGFKVSYIERGVAGFDDRIIHFQDRDGNEGEVYANRVGRNTFQYSIVSDMYDVDHDDLYEPEIDPDDIYESEESVSDISSDESSINKYLTLKYHFMDKGYSEKEAEDLAKHNFDKEYVDESMCESVADKIVTIGLYGDDTGNYESLDQMIRAMKSAGLTIEELEGGEEYGWSFNVKGPAKKIYKMVDGEIPGYNCDGVQEFIDQYSIDEVDESCNEDYIYTDDMSDTETDLCEGSSRNYVLIGYRSDPEAGIEGDTINPIMVLGATNDSEASEKCYWVQSHLYMYPEAQGYDDISYMEVDDDYIREYFGEDYLNESKEELDVKKHKVGDKIYVSKEGMTDPDSYSVGDDIKIGALRGTIDKVYPDKFDITITYNGFVDEDTVKKSNGKWTNKGKHGEHGEFSSKKKADAQRKAMFANGYRESIDEALEDDPEVADQEYSSADTSINSSKLPAVFKMVKFNPGTINLDYGGGKYDNAAKYLEDTYEATNLVYDPYNRTPDHNKEVLSKVRENGGADTVTCSNVLNVIKEPEARLAVIRNCKNYLKDGGKAYFTVYEGSGKGDEGPTKAGYQLNKRTADYVEEISKVFNNVTRRGKLIIAEAFIKSNPYIIEASKGLEYVRQDFYDWYIDQTDEWKNRIDKYVEDHYGSYYELEDDDIDTLYDIFGELQAREKDGGDLSAPVMLYDPDTGRKYKHAGIRI